MKSKELITPNSELVRIDYSDAELECYGFKSWILLGNSRGVAITTAKAGVAENAPDLEVVAEGSWNGAVVQKLRQTPPPGIVEKRSSKHAVQRATTFVYRGSYHEFETTMSGDAALDQFETLLRRVFVREEPGGISVRPRRAIGGRVSTHFMVGQFGDVAGVTSYFAESGARRPRNRGRRIGKRELWAIDDETVLVANESSISTLGVIGGRRMRSKRFEELAETLSVERG